MCGQGGEIFDGVEDNVDWLGNVEVEVVDLGFLGLDLLRSELSIGGEQMEHEVADAAGVLAGGSVEKGTEVDGVNSIDHLGNESFFSCLTSLKLLEACGPDITSRIDLSRSSRVWRDKRTRIGGSNPCSGWL